MNLIDVRNELSIRGKNGLPFLMSAVVVWLIILGIFLLPLGIKEQNIYLFFSTGIMFPLAILISKLIKADWQFPDQALGELGLYFNLSQFLYFPIIFWAFAKSREEMVMIFAIITGAHLFPYGWLYRAKPFYFAAPIIALIIMFIGLQEQIGLWVIPMAMSVLLTILNIFLYIDFKHKIFIKGV